MNTRDGEHSRDKAAVKRVARVFFESLQGFSDRTVPVLDQNPLDEYNLPLVSCQTCHLDYQGSHLCLVVIFARHHFPFNSGSYILYQPSCEA
jgi:hypothetical protein